LREALLPITIPPFVQYQQPIVPLRGLWNNPPPEGDRFANIEIDWITTTNGATAVQILFSANSPVAFSQIVALAVDNRRSAFDINFVFPDSNFTLTVPADNQGVYPVFTNALMFYVLADPAVVAGNVTVFQVLNSMPPPVALNPSAVLETNAVAGTVGLTAGNTQQIVPLGVSGTMDGFLVTINYGGSGPTSATLELIDGAGSILWTDVVAGQPGTSDVIPITGIHVRFINGVSLKVIAASPAGVSSANANIFYTTP
jgi:hypothetical protein